jgi:hypothetical protein
LLPLPASGRQIIPISTPLVRHSNRFWKQSVRLNDYVLSVIPEGPDLSLPEHPIKPPIDQISLEKALQHQGWTAAMKDELLFIRKNHTYDLVPLLSGKCTISSKWVFKTQPGVNGQPPCLKARLVACGFEQRHGIDFDEVFAPVVKWSTIKTLAARSVLRQHQIHYLGVRTVFLYGILHDEVYMEQPLDFTSKRNDNLVWKLNCALHGLRQSPHHWYECINSYLTSIGMTRSNSDYNIYHIGTGHNKIILVVYVDNLFITSGDKRKISWLKQQLKKEFDITDLGPVTKYLGVEFQQHSEGLFLSQYKYTLDILKEFGMEHSRFEHVPLPPGIQLTLNM